MEGIQIMRLTKERSKQVSALTEKLLFGKVDTLDRSELATAAIHVRFLLTLGEEYKAINWHRRYKAAFAKFGLSMPAMGRDGRGATSAANPIGGGRLQRATVCHG